MEPLGALSGASGGMADAVAGIIEQRMRQAQVANQVEETNARTAQAQAALAETTRAHMADEATRQQTAEAMSGYRTAVEQDTKSRNAATAASQYQGMLKTLPTGTNFTPEGYQTAISKGAIPEQFGAYKPPSLGMSTPAGEQGPTQGGMPFLGIQSELDKANKLPPSENLAQLRVEVSNILSKPPNMRTPEEDAKVTGYKGLKDVEGEQAMSRLNVTLANADTRQQRGFTNSAQEKAHYDLQKTIDAQPLPQAAKIMETLNAPGGVNDAIAVPQFLSALAGGSGSGLRMTQAELNLIQKARPTTESVMVKLNNLAGNYQALTPQQRQDMMTLVRSIASREAQVADMYTATQARVDAAKSPDEVLGHMNRLNSQQTAMYRGMIDPGATAPAAGAPATGAPAASGGGEWVDIGGGIKVRKK